MNETSNTHTTPPPVAMMINPDWCAQVNNYLQILIGKVDEQQKQIDEMRKFICDTGGLITEKEAEKILSCSRATIYRLIKDGIINPVPMYDGNGEQKRVLRFRKTEIYNFLNTGK